MPRACVDAYKIEVKSDDATEIEVKANGVGGRSQVEFIGIVESLPGTQGQLVVWTVSGRKVSVTADTRINWEEGPVAVGSKVGIRGSLQSDGSINAVKIKVKDHSGQFEFKGAIESLPAAANLIGDWSVSGLTIHVFASTQIERKYGMVMVGSFVEVHGLRQSDGSINATEVEVKGLAGDSRRTCWRNTSIPSIATLARLATSSCCDTHSSGRNEGYFNSPVISVNPA